MIENYGLCADCPRQLLCKERYSVGNLHMNYAATSLAISSASRRTMWILLGLSLNTRVLVHHSRFCRLVALGLIQSFSKIIITFASAVKPSASRTASAVSVTVRLLLGPRRLFNVSESASRKSPYSIWSLITLQTSALSSLSTRMPRRRRIELKALLP